VEQGTRGKVCALAGRRFGLRPGRAVTWPKYWRAWLEQGEVVQVPDTRANEALPATPLLQLHAIGTYIIAPALAADGRLHGLLLGMGSMRRPTTLPTQQLCIVQAAARLLSCVGKLEERLAAAERRAAHMLEESLRDELTGVANRRGIEQALRQEADRLRGRDHEVTVLFVDLDGLKRVNDDHGHDAGDALICNAAQALIQAARGGDTVGRLGGDELVVVLPRRHSSTSVEATVARFAEALHAAGVPASIGAASTEETGSVHAAVTLADKRMLAHKRKARRHPLSVPSERE
jgi:diguanylate cyclase (GGDEF)-like protein